MGFYQDQKSSKPRLIHIEVSKNDSDRVVDLIIYKNHYALIKKSDIILRNHNCKFVCRKRLNSYIYQKMLIKHKEKCGQKQITIIRS